MSEARRMTNRVWVFVSTVLLLVATGTLAYGHSIDYESGEISPSASFHGSSGNFSLIEPAVGGTVIQFNLTFKIDTKGSTTSYPRTVTWARTDVTKPVGSPDPAVTFGPGADDSFTGTFLDSETELTTSVAVTAPGMPGAYSIKIHAIAGTGGSHGLSPGGGVVVGFTVSNACAQADTGLALSIDPPCILYRSAEVAFNATLTSDGWPVAGKYIDFTVNGIAVGYAVTDGTGMAVLDYDPSSLSVGDHTVVASFQGDDCQYNSSGQSATLGVVYDFLGFQPPVRIDGVGAGLFSGRVVPVKVVIADAYGEPVPDAEAFVFFSQTSANVTYEEAESIHAGTPSDAGNQMRYDPAADQYIFNWDLAKVSNGSYNIRIHLGEGGCGGSRLATVIVQKNSGGKKK